MIFCLLHYVGLCNTCLEGLPPFQNSETVTHFLSNSQLSTRYDVLFPNYEFIQSGRISRWEVFLTRVPFSSDNLRITFSVWRRTGSFSNCVSSGIAGSPINQLYCRIGANQINVESNNVVQQSRLLQFNVSRSRRIQVSPGDVVGFEIETPSEDLDILFSSEVSTDVMTASIGAGQQDCQAPLMNIQLGKHATHK